jgi:hypothetical protein
LVPLRDWTRLLAGEPGPTTAGTITITNSITPKQKSAAVTVMRENVDGKGHFAYGSTTKLLYYERFPSGSGDPEGPRQVHLALQAMTGGAASRGRGLPAAAPDGRTALEDVLTMNWLPPTRDDHHPPADLDDLRSVFRGIFPDGAVFDTQTLDGASDMRELDSEFLAGVLPAAVNSMEDGVDTILLAGRRLTPLYRGGVLRLLFILPAGAEPARVRDWLGTVRAWHLGTAATDSAGYARHG